MIVRTDTGIPKGNDAHTRVRIIAYGGADDALNGCILPAASVLTAPQDSFGKAELAAEIASGCGLDEWDVGTQCRIISVSVRNTNPDYVLDALFEYNGGQWLPITDGGETDVF